jgi:DNA-binding protein HU-beta
MIPEKLFLVSSLPTRNSRNGFAILLFYSYNRSLNQLLNFKLLNTKEFIRALAEKLDVSQKEAVRLLDHTTQVMREMISEEKKLTILHLGSFHVKKTASRSSYIPALDKKALVPPKSSVQFHPADSLKDKFKNPGQP